MFNESLEDHCKPKINSNASQISIEIQSLPHGAFELKIILALLIDPLMGVFRMLYDFETHA